jgi:hypothetical protein
VNLKAKLLITLTAVVVLAGAATTYTLQAKAGDPPDILTAVDPGRVLLTEPGRLLFRNEAPGPDHGKVASVSLTDPLGARRISSMRCDRFYSSAGNGFCLADAPGPLPSAIAVFTGSDLTELKRVEVAGVPNRAKLSADGRMASWTTFVTGDSYAQTGTFSTRTAILDREQDQLTSNMENIPLIVAGRRHRSDDVNFWGVTFATGNRTFFATVATGGQTHLLQGDFEAWEAHTLRENVECPSLSPDGRRIAFKKRIAQDGARPWHEHVLDLATMTETPLAESRSIDDQVIWLDDTTIAYALPGEHAPDIWAVPADGTGTPRLLVRYASSPSR